MLTSKILLLVFINGETIIGKKLQCSYKVSKLLVHKHLQYSQSRMLMCGGNTPLETTSWR